MCPEFNASHEIVLLGLVDSIISRYLYRRVLIICLISLVVLNKYGDNGVMFIHTFQFFRQQKMPGSAIRANLRHLMPIPPFIASFLS